MKFTILIFLTIVSAGSCFSIQAQETIRISTYPGYHIINSDKPSAEEDASKTNWMFGGSISVPVEWKGYSLEIALGYAEGNSTVYTFRSTSDVPTPPITYEVDLRYRTLPVEIFWVKRFNSKFELMGGLNLVAQHRILSFPIEDMPNDRLLSYGMGLSGKLRTYFIQFASGKASVFGNIALRWTEYFIHDNNGRDLDDFEFRHVMISPQFGISWDL